MGHLASAEQLQALLQRSKEASKSAETSIPVASGGLGCEPGGVLRRRPGLHCILVQALSGGARLYGTAESHDMPKPQWSSKSSWQVTRPCLDGTLQAIKPKFQAGDARGGGLAGSRV